MYKLPKNNQLPQQQPALFDAAPEPGELASAVTPEEERRIALSRYMLTQWDKQPRRCNRQLIADLIEE